ncbi:MAG: tetratricopeptide repeat protein [Chitinophagales bacterium]|nr:tetratricopeptide repeat protein [Chitinophagales bacterium]MCZ2393603.1 tetratricopeptide repeat protein [Chitinophagales bacterium]
MNPFDDENEEEESIQDIINKYEYSLEHNTSIFLEPESFEVLVDFYNVHGLYNSAFTAIDQALEQHPTSALLLIKKAQLQFETKEISSALDTLNLAESIDFNELGIHLLKAEIFTYLSRHEEAIAILQYWEAQTEYEDLVDVYLQMADVYEDWEKYNEVFDSLKKCLLIEPSNEEALSRINYCMEITQEYKRSKEFYELLIDKHPYSELAWYNLATAYRGMKELDLAIDTLQYTIAINEDLGFPYHDLAELYFQKKEYLKALEALKEYEDRFNSDEDTFLLKGHCHESLEEYKLARYYFKKALHIQPNIADAYYRIGETYKAEDNWEKAYTFYIKAAELDKSEYDYQIIAAEAAQVVGKIDKAVELAEIAMEISPIRFEAYILLAQIFLLSNEAEISMEIIEKGLAICKSNTELKYAKVSILFYLGYQQEARILLRLLIEEHPGKEVFMLYMYPEIENDPEIDSILSQLP